MSIQPKFRWKPPDQGLIQMLKGSSQRCYDGIVDNHYHIHYVGCGLIGDIAAGSESWLMKSVNDLFFNRK